MKLTSSLVIGAFAALSLVAVPACDDKKEDGKADGKADDKKADAKADAKAGDVADAKADGKADDAGEAGEEAKDEDDDDFDDGEAKAEGEDAAADGAAADAADGGGEDLAGRSIGVPECDEYITNYAKCIDDKLAPSVKETTRKSLETSIELWKKAAATPAGREGVVQACTTAAQAVKASCGW